MPTNSKSAGAAMDRELTAFERAVTAAIGGDPRHDNTAKAQIEEAFPTNNTDDTPLTKEQIEQGFEGLLNNEVAEWVRDNEMPATTLEEVAAEEAAELFASDEELEEELNATPAESNNKTDTKTDDSDATLWPEALPKAVLGHSDLTQVLDFYNVSENQVLEMLVTQEKPLSQASKETVWKQELLMAELTEADINDTIHEFLSKGYVETKHSLFNGKVAFTLRSRAAEDDMLREAHVSKFLRDNDGVVVHSLQVKLEFMWKIAASLRSFAGFAQEHIELPDELSNRVKIVEALPAPAFQLVSQSLSRLDSRCYFAAQKMAIGNF